VEIIVGFSAGLLAIAAAILVARRFRLLDTPNGIKIHRTPVPFTGGLAWVVALLLSAPFVHLPFPFIATGMCIWAVGFVDDLWNLSPVLKIAFLCAALAIAAPAMAPNVIAGVAAVVLGAVLINVFNVLDGLDGLAAGTALFTLLPSALLEGPTQSIASVTVGFLASFLILNVSPAKIFLGNQGSFTLGYVIWFVAAYPLVSVPAYSSAATFALLWLVPFANTSFVVVRRLHEGRSILIGDRSHFYDLLWRRIGLRATVALFWTASALAATIAGFIRA